MYHHALNRTRRYIGTAGFLIIVVCGFRRGPVGTALLIASDRNSTPQPSPPGRVLHVFEPQPCYCGFASPPERQEHESRSRRSHQRYLRFALLLVAGLLGWRLSAYDLLAVGLGVDTGRSEYCR